MWSPGIAECTTHHEEEKEEDEEEDDDDEEEEQDSDKAHATDSGEERLEVRACLVILRFVVRPPV